MNPNIIEIDRDLRTVKVTMTRRNGDQHATLVDLAVWPYLSLYHFHPHAAHSGSNKFYAATTRNGRLTMAHTILMESYLTAEFPEVDHKNSRDPGTTLDNRLSNLRVATRKENMNNTAKNHLKGGLLEPRPAVHCFSIKDNQGLTVCQKSVLNAVKHTLSVATDIKPTEAQFMLDLLQLIAPDHKEVTK